jgi:hypothetical protein
MVLEEMVWNNVSQVLTTTYTQNLFFRGARSYAELVPFYAYGRKAEEKRKSASG